MLIRKLYKKIFSCLLTDMEKREIIIANVMRTGKCCYTDPLNTKHCVVCDSGPCPGPIEKYKEI